MSAVIESERAVKLAWHDGEQYRTSEYGYVEPGAAVAAAPTLNQARHMRCKQTYTHLLEFAGEKLVAVKPLEAS